MKYAIYGSLGIAGHVIESIRYRGRDNIVLIVDEENRVGQEVEGFEVQSPETLKNESFDQVIIATMAYSQALKKIYDLGYSSELICDEVRWNPFFLQLEPTTRCNFSCVNCSHKDLPWERKNQDLNLWEFARILDENPDLKRLQLQGLGEPLLNRDLVTMLKNAHHHGISTSITTNGARLNKGIGTRLKTHLDKLVISLDTVEEDLFTQLRRGGNWKKIRTNIENFLAVKTYTSVVYNCVISFHNLASIEGVIQFAFDTQPGEVHLQLAENWYIPGQKEFAISHQIAIKDAQQEQEILTIIQKWRPLLKEKGINLTYTGADKRKGFCWWPFFGMFISVDGYVTPCCIRMQPEIFNLGNIFEQSLEEIWYGEPYKNFRKTMFQDRENGICDYCPL